MVVERPTLVLGRFVADYPLLHSKLFYCTRLVRPSPWRLPFKVSSLDFRISPSVYGVYYCASSLGWFTRTLDWWPWHHGNHNPNKWQSCRSSALCDDRNDYRTSNRNLHLDRSPFPYRVQRLPSNPQGSSDRQCERIESLLFRMRRYFIPEGLSSNLLPNIAIGIRLYHKPTVCWFRTVSLHLKVLYSIQPLFGCLSIVVRRFV